MACDGDEEPWCCNVGFEESCDQWHYCGNDDFTPLPCFDKPVVGGPYSDTFTTYPEKIPICEGYTYTFEIFDSFGDGLCGGGSYYLELNGTRFHEGGCFEYSETYEFTSLVTAFVLSGSLAFEGIARSGRHKSGIALRFPRIHRWRRDLGVGDADRLEDLERLLADPSAD